MNRATFIERLTEVQGTVQQLLDQLQASEHDKFAAHLYQSRREYRHISERPGKGNKQIERCVISTYQIAQSLGFKGRLSRLGALAADSRVKAQIARGKSSADAR
jgi:hypothetical protein